MSKKNIQNISGTTEQVFTVNGNAVVTATDTALIDEHIGITAGDPHGFIAYLGFTPSNALSDMIESDDAVLVSLSDKGAWNGKQDALNLTPVPDTRLINGYDLTSDISLDYSDVSAAPLLHTHGYEPANSNIQNHINITSGNPHGVDFSGIYEPADSDIQYHIGLTIGNPHHVTYSDTGAASDVHTHGYEPILGFTPENISNKSNDISGDANSTIKYLSVKAAKDYMDSLVSGFLNYRGSYDASSNVYPTTGGSGNLGAIAKGDSWTISIPGTLSGGVVHVGDFIISNTNNPGQTQSNWNTLDTTISYVPEDSANKSSDTALGNSHTKYPDENAVKTYADTKADLLHNHTHGQLSGIQGGTEGYHLSFADYQVNTRYATASQGGNLSAGDFQTFSGKQDALGFTPENVTNKSTNTTLGTSVTLYPCENVVKANMDLKAPLANPVFTGSIKTPIITAPSDSATSIQVMKADGSTPFIKFNSTNSRIEIPMSLQITGITAQHSIAGGSWQGLSISDSLYYTFLMQRASSTGLNNIVANGYKLGVLDYKGYDGTAYQNAVEIRAEVDGNPSIGSMPGRLLLMVTPSGSVTPVEAMRITNTKYVGINTIPQRRLDVLDNTNPQSRDTHTDNSVYTDKQTTSDGVWHIYPTGLIVQPKANIYLSSQSSTQERVIVAIKRTMPVATDASRTGLLTETVSDFSGERTSRTVLADGSKVVHTFSGISGFGIAPTALITLAAGTATANTAPIKLISGVLLTSPEVGAIEFVGDRLTITGTTSITRKDIADFSYRDISALRTLDGSDEFIECTANSFTVTLPTAIGFTKQYVIKNTGTGIITVATLLSQTIDGQVTQILNQWDSLTLRSNGSNWLIV